MKTWQVFKILLDNPKARFIRKSNGYEYSINGDNVLDRPRSLWAGGYEADEDWELVREKVDFMTAFTVWLGGKAITVERSNPHVWDAPSIGAFQRDAENLDNSWWHTNDIIFGKWYIE